MAQRHLDRTGDLTNRRSAGRNKFHYNIKYRHREILKNVTQKLSNLPVNLNSGKTIKIPRKNVSVTALIFVKRSFKESLSKVFSIHTILTKF